MRISMPHCLLRTDGRADCILDFLLSIFSRVVATNDGLPTRHQCTPDLGQSLPCSTTTTMTSMSQHFLMEVGFALEPARSRCPLHFGARAGLFQLSGSFCPAPWSQDLKLAKVADSRRLDRCSPLTRKERPETRVGETSGLVMDQTRQDGREGATRLHG